jgi:ligand-binding sensor domain-containing protein
MTFYIILVISLLILTPSASTAQDDYLIFSQLSIDEGLSQSIVSCITQDHQGFMWFGTEDGLNRYDGYDIKIIRHEPDNPNSLSYNEILCIMEDRRGYMWIGTFNGGLNQYDPTTRQFKHYRNDPSDATSLSHDIVRVVYEDRAGNILVGTDTGLNVLDRETGKFRRYMHDPNALGTLSSDSILSILEDKQGTLWVGTNGGGLNWLDLNDTEFEHFEATLDNGNCLGHQTIRSLCEDGAGPLWVGTDGGGLVKINPDRNNHQCYLHDPADPSSLSNNRIYAIYEDQNGIIWVGTDDGGLLRMNPATDSFTAYVNDPNDSSSITYNQIRAIFEDRSGVIWVGTYGGGVNRFDGKQKAFQLYKPNPMDTNSLSHDIIWSIHENSQGDLWIGTHGGGLDHLNRSTGQYTNFRHDDNNPNTLSHDVVRVVLEDRNGLLWLGTNGGGVCTLDPSTGEFQNFRNDPRNSGSISHNQIRSIYEDKDGTIWVGTNGGGLNRLDRSTGLFTRYQHDPADPISLSNDYVRVIFEDSRGLFWVGTQGGGLERFEKQTGKFIHTRNIPGQNNSLSNDFIFSIFEDRDNILWLGTWGGGLNRFDVVNNQYTHFTTEDGLASNAIYGVLQDESGRLWMSTNNGLSRFNPQTGIFKSFNVEDGLQSNEFNGGSYFRSPTGEIFFGGIHGFNSFFPAAIKDNPIPPPIAITSFLKMNQEYHFSRPIGMLDQITISHQDFIFSFEFAALDFSAPRKNQYAYMMEGLHENWIFTGSNKRSATFTTLAPGKYRFWVIGSNNDGVWNKEGTSVDIVITPPYSQTWWFRTLMVLLFAGLVSLFFHWRINNVRITSELQTARTAQLGIMPQSDPDLAEYDISGVCIPAYEVGGDFYDIFWQDREKTHLGVAVGDVSGKAMKAAMVAVLSSGMVYCGADKCRLPSALFKQLNRSLFAKTDDAMFTALSFLSIDVECRDITYAMAAMEPPVVVAEGKSQQLPDTCLGLPLGAFKDTQYQDCQLRLESGQVLVLYTDGVVEARNKAEEFYDSNRLLSLLDRIPMDDCSALEIKEMIVDNVRQFTGGTLQHDDMTLVVIKAK